MKNIPVAELFEKFVFTYWHNPDKKIVEIFQNPQLAKDKVKCTSSALSEFSIKKHCAILLQEYKKAIKDNKEYYSTGKNLKKMVKGNKTVYGAGRAMKKIWGMKAPEISGTEVKLMLQTQTKKTTIGAKKAVRKFLKKCNPKGIRKALLNK
jgi:hypothetical protein